jgi:hypothetical protein
MSWTKIDNPKPASPNALGKDNVKIVARAGMKGHRYIIVKIGPEIARKSSFTKADHRCHILVGSDEERGNLAITVDDSDGKFTARRKKDGRYEISITAPAADGRFSLIFPPFERPAKAVSRGNGNPAFITFAATDEFFQ